MTDSLITEPKPTASGTWASRRRSAFALLLGGLMALLAGAMNLPAQTGGAPKPALPAQDVSSNRFLFIVDTSAGMKSHLADVVNVVQDIIRTSANGQLHNGDTIGVWTFNETIYTGNLPLQQWAADDSEEIALRMTEFFRQQPFVKKSRLDLAMLGLAEIVKHSDIITVFILSDGSGRMQGTPFDQQINASYQQILQDMKKDRRPIVTVLQAKGGRLIRYTVNAVPWPVVIPEVPIPIRLANVPPARSAPTTAGVVATSTNIMPESKPTSAAAIVPPQSAPAMPSITSMPNQPVPRPQSVVPATTPATPPVMPPQIPPVTAPTAMTPSTGAPGPNPVEKITTTPAMPAQKMPGPTTVATKPPTNGQSAMPSGATPLSRPATATNQVMAQNKVPPAPSSKPARISESNPKPAATGTNTAPAPARPKASLIAQGTALMKSFAEDHPRMLLIGGGAMIVIALGLIVLLVRRSRRSARISLISQTLDDLQQ